jgi:2-dehydro-3-deoxyphosphooctonate aldolase (KDO 8-P synthase)
VKPLHLGDIAIGGGSPIVLIAGPCVIESGQHASELAGALADIARRTRVPFIFKASYDKANRTSGASFRGPGIDAGLRVLADIKARHGVPILTDIHEPAHAAAAAAVADVLQIPAFLCRQTDLLLAAAKTGRLVNIKKGQFLAPDDMTHAVRKVVEAGNTRVIITERGTSFGYHNLIVDMRAFPMMRAQGVPVVFDVTHSLQLPGGGDGVSAGLAEYIEPLASAGVAAGVDGVFLEVHEDPSRARSDAQNALRLDSLEALLRRLTAIDAIAKREEAVRGAAPSGATDAHG